MKYVALAIAATMLATVSHADDDGGEKKDSGSEVTNVCDQKGMLKIQFSGTKGELIIHKPQNGPLFQGIVCADEGNDNIQGAKGEVYVYFSEQFPFSDDMNKVGALEANTCMYFWSETHVFASISTKGGGKACMKRLYK